jgi:restriction system protein
MPMPDWNDYQEEVADFFRGIGLEAATNETVEGIRTSHDIDVAVRTNHVGLDLFWVIECKQWKSPITKLHVLALREIVADTGADRGIMMAENGYQRGALEAAQLTNVQLTSLVELSITARGALDAVQLNLMQERIDSCEDRYWNLDKETRISLGLRPPVGIPGYSSIATIRSVRVALNAAARGKIPIEDRDIGGVYNLDLIQKLKSIQTSSELIDLLTPMVVGLEERLDAAYRAIAEDSDTGSDLPDT